MNNIAIVNKFESALVMNDLSKLNDNERLQYYKSVCDSLGLNYLTQPFAYITLNNKLTLYAKRDATDQLRKIHEVSIQITSRELIDGIYIVTSKAFDKSGRIDESTGAVNVEGLKGESKANAFLKCETKAKRRVTLSICGLGLLDETEIESIPLESKVELKLDLQKNPFNEIKEAPLQIAMDPGLYVAAFGKYKGKALKDVDKIDLNNYCKWIIESAQKGGKEIKNGVKEFLDSAETYLLSLEKRVSDNDSVPF